MSVTFNIVRMTVGTDRVLYESINPPDYDPTPVVDPEFPEYGAIPPDNSWELNVANGNAAEILKTFGVTDVNEETSTSGMFLNMEHIIDVCEQMLATLRSIPEMDLGTNSIEYSGPGATIIRCGHMPGWYEHRFTRLLTMAKIAKERDAVICYS